jgi:rsbT co-antagonist protein RsbR
VGSGLDLTARRRDGSTFPVEISLSAFPTVHGLLVTSVIRDISERKRAQEVPARQTEQLREQASLLNLAHDAILVRDLSSKILFWNRGAEELYGWSSDAAVGQETHTLLATHFSGSLAAIDAALMRDGRWEGELAHT